MGLVPAPESSMMLVNGPRFTGRETVLYELLGSYTGQTAIISTCKTAEKAQRQYQIQNGSNDLLTVIDCVSVPAGCPNETGDRHIRAEHPTNLTDIGTRTTELFDTTHRADGVLAVSNLTAITVYHEPETVLKFVHKLQQLLRGHGWKFVIGIDTTAAPHEVTAQLYERVDTIVDTRNANGTCEYRIRGSQTQEDWQPQPAALQPATMTAATTPRRE